MRKKYFVVGDVHSFYDKLMGSLNDKGFEKDNSNHYLILCGDLFDRGPQSRELLAFVQSLGNRFIYIRGNHEDLLSKCLFEIASDFIISSHHISNGTLSTIAQLADVDEYQLISPRRAGSLNQEVYDKIKPIIEWINEKSINYFELGNYIFVHGWIPCFVSPNRYAYHKYYTFDPDWSKEPVDSNSPEFFTYISKWEEARWINGMEAWKHNIKIPGKTIVCGHWHCSWGWSHLDQKRKEFPDKNLKDWQKSFEPYIKEGIIALDACTAYSGIVNCYAFEVEDNG